MDFFKNVLKGFVFSLITAVLLVLVFSYVCYKQNDPRALMGVFGKIALAVSSLVGGFAAAKANKNNGVLAGLASGGLYSVVLLLISFALRGEESTNNIMGWLLLVVAPLLSALGGYIAMSTGKKRKRHSYKRKRL